jgi:hypothetical protein
MYTCTKEIFALVHHLKIYKFNYPLIKHFRDFKMLKDCIVIQQSELGAVNRIAKFFSTF